MRRAADEPPGAAEALRRVANALGSKPQALRSLRQPSTTSPSAATWDAKVRTAIMDLGLQLRPDQVEAVAGLAAAKAAKAAALAGAPTVTVGPCVRFEVLVELVFLGRLEMLRRTYRSACCRAGERLSATAEFFGGPARNRHNK